MAALSTAIIVGSLAVASAAAYSATTQASAAKKAASVQENVGLKQIEASLKAPQLAADAARTRLKAKQASATPTILTTPGGMGSDTANTNQKSILGV